MVPLLDVALQDTSSGWLVEASSFQDMGRIDPVVGLSSHDMFPLSVRANKLELPNWILQSEEAVSATVYMAAAVSDGWRKLTPLYVAEKMPSAATLAAAMMNERYRQGPSEC